MNTEKEAWQRCILMGILPGEEYYSPAKAKEGYYSSLVKTAAKEIDLSDSRAPAAAVTKAETVTDGLQSLESMAADLTRSDHPRNHRIVHLREAAKGLGLRVTDGELRRILSDAKRRSLGVAEGVGDRPLSFDPVPWFVEGLLMRGSLNLVVGPPKVGKTSLLAGLFGAWGSGATTYMGLPLIGPCPPVLVVGPDQPESDWARLLFECRLLDHEKRLRRNLIVDLFPAGSNLQLDDDGIETIAAYAADHPGLIVLIDSLAAVTSRLGISENDSEIAGPIQVLVEALAPHGATAVLIHHAGKASITASPSMASRGSSAIAASASQIVSLSRLADGQQGGPAAGAAPDRRVVIKTEGRGGCPVELLAERTDAGWISHGDAVTVQAERWRQQEEARLTDRQGQALTEVRDRWETDRLPMDTQTLADLMELKGDHGRRTARETLDALARRGLLTAEINRTANGRRKVYRPGMGDHGGVCPPIPPFPPIPPIPLGTKQPESARPRMETEMGEKGWMGGDGRHTPSHPPADLPSPGAPASQPVLPIDAPPPVPLPPAPIADDDDPHWPPRTLTKP